MKTFKQIHDEVARKYHKHWVTEEKEVIECMRIAAEQAIDECASQAQIRHTDEEGSMLITAMKDRVRRETFVIDKQSILNVKSLLK